MFLSTFVLDWRVDGGNRVPNKTAGNLYILNTNRMFEIRSGIDTDPQLYYFDNLADFRDAGAHMRLDHTQSTVANLITASNSDHGAETITLDAYIDNDINGTTESVTINKAAIAYCYPYGNVQSHAKTWVVYSDGAFDVKRRVINMSWIPLIVALEV